jgi:tRNA 2-selenouridine synthase
MAATPLSAAAFRDAAIRIGLDAFGPKMRAMVEAVEHICRKANTRKVLVHCWRGGMLSNAVAWLLDLYGFEVSLLVGGYKAYRQ